MKIEPTTRLRTLMLIGAIMIVLVAVAVVIANWDGILTWLHPAGRGK